MIIALPIVDGKLSMHFGHCEKFALVEVDEGDKKIIKTEYVGSPPHQPGMLPQWLRERGANMIIAGGIGRRAQAIFSTNNIEVVTGASGDEVENIVRAYMNGELESGDNLCDH